MKHPKKKMVGQWKHYETKRGSEKRILINFIVNSENYVIDILII